MNPGLVVLFFLLAGLAYRHRIWIGYAIAMALSGLGAGLVAQLVKFATLRGRPELWLGPFQHARSSASSFPSGHTVGAFALAGVLLFGSRSLPLRVIAVRARGGHRHLPHLRLPALGVGRFRLRRRRTARFLDRDSRRDPDHERTSCSRATRFAPVMSAKRLSPIDRPARELCDSCRRENFHSSPSAPFSGRCCCSPIYLGARRARWLVRSWMSRASSSPRGGSPRYCRLAPRDDAVCPNTSGSTSPRLVVRNPVAEATHGMTRREVAEVRARRSQHCLDRWIHRAQRSKSSARARASSLRHSIAGDERVRRRAIRC